MSSEQERVKALKKLLKLGMNYDHKKAIKELKELKDGKSKETS